MATREPQLYDTISKGGNFWRIVSIENGVITAKRLHGADNGLKHKTGRPLKGTKEEIEKRGYHFCDIPPVKVYYLEPEGEKTPITETSAAEEIIIQEEKEALEEDAKKLAVFGGREANERASAEDRGDAGDDSAGRCFAGENESDRCSCECALGGSCEGVRTCDWEERGNGMSNAVMITGLICLTVIILSLINKE